MGVKVRERPKGSGVWWILIDHHSKRKSKKIGKNKKLAQEAAKKIEAKLTLGDFKLNGEEEPKTPTLKEYVNGWKDQENKFIPGWFDKQAKLGLKRSTWRNYRVILKKHILPEFGDQRLDEITGRTTAAFLVSKIKSGLSSKTAKNIKNCLSSVLSYAHQPDGYLERNPIIGVKVPKPEGEKAKREPDPFSWEDRTIFEETFREHFPRYYAFVVTAFRTGLRIGELMALQWGDIDFKHRLIRVARNISMGRVTTPKSKSSVRDVRMTSQLVEELKALMTSRKAETLKKGWSQVPEWVFCNEEGNFTNTDNLRHRVWKKAVKKSELRRRTPHDMRHTYATLRLSKGDSLAEVSKEMGHSSAEITYKTYYKWLPKESRTDIDELDNPQPKTQPSATYTQPNFPAK